MNEEVQQQRLVILKLFTLKLPNLNETFFMSKELNDQKMADITTLSLSLSLLPTYFKKAVYGLSYYVATIAYG